MSVELTKKQMPEATVLIILNLTVMILLASRLVATVFYITMLAFQRKNSKMEKCRKEKKHEKRKKGKHKRKWKTFVNDRYKHSLRLL